MGSRVLAVGIVNTSEIGLMPGTMPRELGNGPSARQKEVIMKDESNNSGKRLSLLVLIIVALLLSIGSSYAAVGEKKSATINFVDHGSIRDWRAEGNKAILIETVHNRWYRAEFSTPCYDLPWAEGIALKTHPKGKLNKFSAVVTRYQRCHFRSLEEIPNPSKKATQ